MTVRRTLPGDPRPLTMASGYFRLIARVFGTDPAALAAILDGAGVTPQDLDDLESEISVPAQVRQLDNVIRLLGEDWAVAHANLWNANGHGALGVAVLTARTVGEGFEVFAAYAAARSPFHAVRLRRTRDFIEMQRRMPNGLTLPQRRVAVEVGCIAIRSFLTAFLGYPPNDLDYRFAHPAPGYAERVRAVLGGEVRFDAPLDAVRIPARYWTLPSPHADHHLHQQTIDQLERLARTVRDPHGVVASAAKMLAGSQTGRIGAEELAKSLGLSRRTLIRRLSEAGSSHRLLVEAELKSRAKELLDAGVYSKAEISERLGFADPTSFSRACRRWFKPAAG